MCRFIIVFTDDLNDISISSVSLERLKEIRKDCFGAEVRLGLVVKGFVMYF